MPKHSGDSGMSVGDRAGSDSICIDYEGKI